MEGSWGLQNPPARKDDHVTDNIQKRFCSYGRLVLLPRLTAGKDAQVKPDIPWVAGCEAPRRVGPLTARLMALLFLFVLFPLRIPLPCCFTHENRDCRKPSVTLFMYS